MNIQEMSRKNIYHDMHVYLYVLYILCKYCKKKPKLNFVAWLKRATCRDILAATLRQQFKTDNVYFVPIIINERV
jgi:hypothetical protein